MVEVMTAFMLAEHGASAITVPPSGPAGMLGRGDWDEGQLK